MKSYKNRFISIILCASVLSQLLPTESLGFSTPHPQLNTTDSGIPDYSTQAITQGLESNRFSFGGSRGFWKRGAEAPAVRNFHRPGRTIRTLANRLQGVPFFGKTIKDLVLLHDELSKTEGQTKQITETFKKDIESFIGDLVGISDVEIVLDREAQENIGTFTDPTDNTAYVPLAQTIPGPTEVHMGQIIKPIKMKFKEALFHISDPKMRRRALGIVIGHEMAEMKLLTQEYRFRFRFLLWIARWLGYETIDEQIEAVALVLTPYYFSRVHGRLKKFTRTPSIPLATLLQYVSMTADITLLRTAYNLSSKQYRSSGDEKEYPSGETYASKSTRDARDLLRNGASITTVAAALLQEIPPGEFSAVRAYIQTALPGLDKGSLDEVFGLILAIKHLQKMPSNLHLSKEPNHVIQYENNFEAQFIESVAKMYKVPYTSLLAFTMVDNLNGLSTINPDTQSEELRTASQLNNLVLAPLAERHGRGIMANELYNSSLRFSDPELYERTRERFRARLGMTHEQAQTQITYFKSRLNQVLHDQYKISPSLLPWGTSVHGRDNPDGREKWYASAGEKDISDTSIENQMDPVGWMVVVDSYQEVERLRHTLDEDMGTEERPTTRVGQRTRAVRGPDKRIAYQLSNFQFENPYQPGHMVTAELQIMTKEYFTKHYISGQDPAPYRFPHWWLKVKRIADNIIHGNADLKMYEGQQYDHVDPLLTGDFNVDATAILEEINKKDVYIHVPSKPIAIQDGKIDSDAVKTIEWVPLKLPVDSIGADVAFHRQVGGKVESPPALWRLTPSANNRQGYTLERLNLQSSIRPGDIIIHDLQGHSEPLKKTDCDSLLERATSAWAHLSLRDLEKKGNARTISKKRDEILKNLDRKEAADYEANVITPLARSLQLSGKDDFYKAMTLADKEPGQQTTSRPSPFTQFVKDYEALSKKQFVQFNVTASHSRLNKQIVLKVDFDEDQMGILEDSLRIIADHEGHVVAWTTYTSPEGGEFIEYTIELPPGKTRRIEQETLDLWKNVTEIGLTRRRIPSKPPESSRRLQIGLEIPGVEWTQYQLERFAKEMRTLGINIESSHPLPNAPTHQQCVVTLSRFGKKGEEQNSRKQITEALQRLVDDGLLARFTVVNAPLTDKTRNELLSICQHEGDILAPTNEHEFPITSPVPLPKEYAPLKRPGPIDDGFISDFYRALKIMYRYHGNPTGANSWAKLQYWSATIPYAAIQLASTQSFMDEGRQRHPRAILRQLLKDVLRDGPINVWRLIDEDLFPALSSEWADKQELSEKNEVLLRRLQKRFSTIDPTLFSAYKQPLGSTEREGAMWVLKIKILKAAQKEIEATIRESFPIYGDELLAAIHTLETEDLRALTSGESIRDASAKMTERAHQLSMHEDLARKVPETLRYFLPLIMKKTDTMSEEDQEDALFSRRYLLSVLIAETNRLGNIVPDVTPGEQETSAYEELISSLSDFLAFMTSDSSRLLFDHLVDAPTLHIFRAHLLDLKDLSAALYREASVPMASPEASGGDDPAIQAALGPERPMHNDTVTLLIQFMLSEAQRLPPAIQNTLPLQPNGSEAKRWLALSTPDADDEFFTAFRTIWSTTFTLLGFISHEDEHAIAYESHRISLMLEILLGARLRDERSLLAAPALDLFGPTLESRDLERIRAAVRNALPAPLSEELLANVQLVTRMASTTDGDFELLKRYGSPGIKTVKAFDLALRLQSDPRYWTDVLRYFTVLLAGSDVKTPSITLLALRRYLSLLVTAKSIKTRKQNEFSVLAYGFEKVEATRQAVQRGLTAFKDWEIKPGSRYYIPSELGESYTNLKAKLTTLKPTTVSQSNPKPNPGPGPKRDKKGKRRPPAQLKENEWLLGLGVAIMTSYAWAAIGYLMADAQGHIPNMGLEALVSVIAAALLYPLFSGFLAYKVAFHIHENGHMREAEKNYFNVHIEKHRGNYLVFGTPKDFPDFLAGPKHITDDNVVREGPKDSQKGVIVGSVVLGVSLLIYGAYLHSPAIYPPFIHARDLLPLGWRWALTVFCFACPFVNLVFKFADQSKSEDLPYEMGDMKVACTPIQADTTQQDPADLLSFLLKKLDTHRDKLSKRWDIARQLSLARHPNGKATINLSFVDLPRQRIEYTDFDRIVDSIRKEYSQDPPALAAQDTRLLRRRRLWINATEPEQLATIIENLRSRHFWIESIRPELDGGTSFYVVEIRGPDSISSNEPQSPELEKTLLPLQHHHGLQEYTRLPVLVKSCAVNGNASSPLRGVPYNDTIEITSSDPNHSPESWAQITRVLAEESCDIIDFKQWTSDDGVSHILFKARTRSTQVNYRLEHLQIPPLKYRRPLENDDVRVTSRINFYLADQPGSFHRVARTLADLSIPVFAAHQDIHISQKGQRMIELQVRITGNELEHLQSALQRLHVPSREDTDMDTSEPLISRLEITAGTLSESGAKKAADIIREQIEQASSGDKRLDAPWTLTAFRLIKPERDFIHNVTRSLEILDLAQANPDTQNLPRHGFQWIPAPIVTLLKRVLPPSWYVRWLTPDWPMTTAQTRKSNSEPGVLHPKRPAFNLLAIGVRNPIIIIDVILHDAIEDAGKNIWMAIENALLDINDPSKSRVRKELFARFAIYFDDLVPELNQLFESTKEHGYDRKHPTTEAKELKAKIIERAGSLVKERINREIRRYPAAIIHHVDVLSNDADYETYAKNLAERGLSDLLLVKFMEQRDNLFSIWPARKKSPDFPFKIIGKNIRNIAPIAFLDSYVKSDLDQKVIAAYFKTLIDQSYPINQLTVYYERNKETNERVEEESVSTMRMKEAMAALLKGLSNPDNQWLTKELSPEKLSHFLKLLETEPTRLKQVPVEESRIPKYDEPDWILSPYPRQFLRNLFFGLRAKRAA